ncbi:protein FAM110A-like isoform X2 [Palaemon carinicauda]
MSMGWGGMVVGPGWWGAGGSNKTAVQLLQESKSRYVKSDHVLGTRQSPARPERLQISSNPNIFLSAPSHTLHVSRPSPAPERRHALGDQSNVINSGVSPSRPIPPSGPSSLGAQPPPLPSRSPRVTPRIRIRGQDGPNCRSGDLRRSLSHGPGDKGDDVQMKLRRLLNTDSRENLASHLTSPSESNAKIPPPTPRRNFKSSPSGTFRAEPATVTAHKSLPDLNRASSPAIETDSEGGTSGRRRPSCPGAIPSVSVPPDPPPRPPRMFRDPPPPPERSPDRPPARPPPPQDHFTQHLSRSAASAGTLMPNDGRRSSDSDVSAYGAAGSGVSNSEEGRRRPILRSRSDVTHERGRWDEDFRPSLAPLDLEAFFESMGLDSVTYRQVKSPPTSPHTPPIYFEEVSSEESGPLGGRRGSSDSDDGRGRLSGPGPGPPLPLRGTGEPSIVEKNARVIKWLFNCQKAQGTYVSRVASTKT